MVSPQNGNTRGTGLTRRKIEPESTASVADALSTRQLLGFVYQIFFNFSIFGDFTGCSEISLKGVLQKIF